MVIIIMMAIFLLQFECLDDNKKLLDLGTQLMNFQPILVKVGSDDFEFKI